MTVKPHRISFLHYFPKRVHQSGTVQTNFANKIICGEKIHTIRKTNIRNYNIGDPLICHSWQGVEYKSKNPFFLNLTVEQTYNFKKEKGLFFLNDNEEEIPVGLLSEIAANEGLKLDEFLRWFEDDNFSGQIISWDKILMYA